MRVFASRSRRSQKRAGAGRFFRFWRGETHAMRRRLFRLRVALAEGRLIYCDYEGPHALSVAELSSLGMTGNEISALVFEEARIAVVRRFGPLRVG